MNDVELNEARDALARRDRVELEELAMRAAVFHVKTCDAACALAPEHSGEKHAIAEDVRQSLREKSTDELIEMLVPLAVLVRELR